MVTKMTSQQVHRKGCRSVVIPTVRPGTAAILEGPRLNRSLIVPTRCRTRSSPTRIAILGDTLRTAANPTMQVVLF
jgi:hypothetical protein